MASSKAASRRAEQPLLAALQQLLGVVVGQIDDATKAAEEAAQAAEEARAARVRDAERTLSAELSLSGNSGNEALQARARNPRRSVAPSSRSCCHSSATAPRTGYAPAKRRSSHSFRQLQDGAIPIEQFGDLTQDEIIERILDLNGSLDDLAGSLQDAAKAAAEAAAAERHSRRVICSCASLGRVVMIRASRSLKKPARREREDAIAAGRSTSFLAFLDQVLASERSKLLSDIAGEAAAAVVGEVANAVSPTDSRNTVSRVLGGVTDVSVQVQNGYLRQVVDYTQATAANTALIASLLGARSVGPIPTPSFPTAGGTITSGAQGGNTFIVNVHTPAITVPTATPLDVGRQIGRAQAEAITEQLARVLMLDIRAIGGRKR